MHSYLDGAPAVTHALDTAYMGMSWFLAAACVVTACWYFHRRRDP